MNKYIFASRNGSTFYRDSGTSMRACWDRDNATKFDSKGNAEESLALVGENRADYRMMTIDDNGNVVSAEC